LNEGFLGLAMEPRICAVLAASSTFAAADVDHGTDVHGNSTTLSNCVAVDFAKDACTYQNKLPRPDAILYTFKYSHENSGIVSFAAKGIGSEDGFPRNL
jgi:hypothetical protein